MYLFRYLLFNWPIVSTIVLVLVTIIAGLHRKANWAPYVWLFPTLVFGSVVGSFGYRVFSLTRLSGPDSGFGAIDMLLFSLPMLGASLAGLVFCVTFRPRMQVNWRTPILAYIFIMLAAHLWSTMTTDIMTWPGATVHVRLYSAGSGEGSKLLTSDENGRARFWLHLTQSASIEAQDRNRLVKCEVNINPVKGKFRSLEIRKWKDGAGHSHSIPFSPRTVINIP